ncbi:MAG: T9SS type A sorting domain-containing protein [Ignavibacteria bacterium]|nr:T9SS type A sorting domain-containing protein [Ignavibacteria bacterium]
MKKLNLLFLLILIVFASSDSLSQGFDFYRISPPLIQGDTSSVNPVASLGIVVNTSSSTQNFKLVRIVNDLPSGWISQLCVGMLCMGPEVDTIPPYPVPGYPIQAGLTDTLYVDFIGPTPGIGTVVMKCYIVNNPNQYIVDTFKVQLNYPSSITPINEIAQGFELKQNYPNPFNPNTKIEFSIHKNDLVNLELYDILGNKVADLINRKMNSGTYSFELNISEYKLSSGTYFYVLTSGINRETRKMVVIK